jgi:hypothetical protein
MSVIIFFSASKKIFFNAEMVCKQLLFCVKAATRLIPHIIMNQFYWLKDNHMT